MRDRGRGCRKGQMDWSGLVLKNRLDFGNRSSRVTPDELDPVSPEAVPLADHSAAARLAAGLQVVPVQMGALRLSRAGEGGSRSGSDPHSRNRWQAPYDSKRQQDGEEGY
ncbi:MAG: hypothetical protein ABFD96_20135 [Armatimonadia bacterium]